MHSHTILNLYTFQKNDFLTQMIYNPSDRNHPVHLINLYLSSDGSCFGGHVSMYQNILFQVEPSLVNM